MGKILIKSDKENNTSPVVSITRCSDYQNDNITQSIYKHFSLLGGVEKFISKGDKVLLKPNFIAPKPRSQAVQTDPAVILAVAKIIKDYGGKPFIGDSPAWGNTSACIKSLELEDPLKKLDIPVKQLNKSKRVKINGFKVGISTVALEADKIINLPKFKTHQQIVATFAVKNMFGCVSGKEKAILHFAKGKYSEDFCKMLIGIYQYLNPILTIIDGVVAMEGNGPISGTPKPLGFLIGGIDPIACETVCCKLINFSPDNLPMIQTARKIGFGCSDFSQIKIIGDNYENYICKDFQIPELIPLRFSFSHVCKSVGKQVVMLTKGGWERK